MSSSHTGRAARSMSDAFGRYTDNRLTPMRDSRPHSRADWALYIVFVITVCLIAYLLTKEAL